MKTVITFDFDGSLAHSRFVQDLFMQVRKDPQHEIHIVTQRYPPPHEEGPEVYALASKCGIPINRIHFTSRVDKFHKLAELGSGLHIDDDPEQINLIRINLPGCVPIQVESTYH